MNIEILVDLIEQAGWDVVNYDDHPGHYKIEMFDENTCFAMDLEFGAEDVLTEEIFVETLINRWEEVCDEFYENLEMYGENEEDEKFFFECLKDDFDNIGCTFCHYLETRVNSLSKLIGHVPGVLKYDQKKEEVDNYVNRKC